MKIRYRCTIIQKIITSCFNCNFQKTKLENIVQLIFQADNKLKNIYFKKLIEKDKQ